MGRSVILLLRGGQAAVLSRSNAPKRTVPCPSPTIAIILPHLTSSNVTEKRQKHGRTGISKARASIRAAGRKHSSARGMARFLLLGIGYVLVFLGTAALPGLGLKLIGSYALFLLIFNLAMVGHDAGHGSLTRSSAWNRWIGRVSFLVSYVPFSGWLAVHNAAAPRLYQSARQGPVLRRLASRNTMRYRP